MSRTATLQLCILCVFGPCAIWWVYQTGAGPHGTLRLFGFVLSLLGLAGVLLARFTLGRAFSVRPKASLLITSGVYSRIRNPIYVFSWFFILGINIMLRIPWLWLVLVVLAPIQMMRAKAEARLLEARFGDEYRQYRASTWF